MNCEKCKKTQATVFYADGSGGRHSLCEGCAKILGKVSEYSPSNGEKKQDSEFLPTPTLSRLQEENELFRIYCSPRTKRGESVCPRCATALETVLKTGRASCPDCYTVFAELLIPSSLSEGSAAYARMPLSRRESIDRTRSIAGLKDQLKIAVEAENYELAASLRDKVRKLESVQRT